MPVQMPPMQEYNVCKAPKAINDQLVFVAMRLSTRSKNEKGNVPPKVADHFTELFCQTAQQFRGYVFETYTAGFGQVKTPLYISKALLIRSPAWHC